MEHGLPRTRWVRTIAEVPPGAWDRLARDAVVRHGWLRTVEATSRAPDAHSYLLAEEDGVLVGAVPVRVSRRSEAVFTLDDCMLGRFRRPLNRLGISFLPALVCGPSHGHGSHLLLAPSLGEGHRRRVAAALLADLEAEADRLGLPVVFARVTDDEQELPRLLERRGYRRALDHPTTRLTIEWTDFSGYLRHVKAVHGSSRFVRKEINRNARAGVCIRRLEDPPEPGGRLFWLLDHNYRRHNNKGFPYGEGFLRELVRHLGADAWVYVAEKGGEPIGVSVMIRCGTAAHVLAGGVDHGADGNGFTYFNIGYYRPVADAAKAGIRCLDFGPTLYQTKRQRGCTVHPAAVFYRPRRRWLGLPLAAFGMVQSAVKPFFIDPKPRGRGRRKRARP